MALFVVALFAFFQAVALPPSSGAFDSLEELIAVEKASDEEQRLFLQEGQGALRFKRRVVLDPGHGGWDSGAVGPSGLKEKDITLDIALRIERLMGEEEPMEVALTRTADYYVDLSERSLMAMERMADLFLSIHINASPGAQARGLEVYFCSERASDEDAQAVAMRENAVLKEKGTQYDDLKMALDDEAILSAIQRQLYWKKSKQLAFQFQKSMPNQLGLLDRGLKSAHFSVLRHNLMPSILLEVGFISNPMEEKRLRQPEFRQQVALAIKEALFRLLI